MNYLQEVPNSVTVYLQYYLKEIGLILRKLAALSALHIKPLLTETAWLKEWYPEDLEQKFTRLCLNPRPKTAANNFLYYFIKPFCLWASLPLVILYKHCRSSKNQRQEQEKTTKTE